MRDEIALQERLERVVDRAELEVAHRLHQRAHQVDLLRAGAAQELLHVDMLVLLVFFGETCLSRFELAKIKMIN